MAINEPVNHNLVKAWANWSLAWLMIFPLIEALVSIKFHHPEFLGNQPWLTFGRLCPVHVNGVIFGAFSISFIALLYYLVPRLCGIPFYRAQWGKRPPLDVEYFSSWSGFCFSLSSGSHFLIGFFRCIFLLRWRSPFRDHHHFRIRNGWRENHFRICDWRVNHWRLPILFL